MERNVSRPQSGTLIGRTAELRALDDLLSQARSGGQAATLIGEAGIGKSSLLTAVAELAARDGFMVLSAVGVESELDLPYAGLHRLLFRFADQLGRLPAPQRQALAAVFGVESDDAPPPFLVALGALTLLSLATGREPVLICLDDVQWLDRPTQDVLAFIARRVGAEPVVVLGTLRRGYASSFVQACNRQIEVRGLDDPASRELLRRHAPDLGQAEQERILSQSLGNPLAIVELPAAWRAAAPTVAATAGEPVPLSARLEAAFAGRLSDVHQAARDALLIAATDNQTDLVEILAASTVLHGQPVGVEHIEPVAQLGLVSLDRHGLTFRHPLIRSAVLQAETLHRRQAAHRALADVLDTDPYRRTWHRGEATIGPDDALADELEYAHTIALRRGAALAAIASLERAASLTTDSSQRGRRLLLAAEHAFGLGRADMVDRLLTAAGRNMLSELQRARMEWLREIFNDGIPGDAARVTELCGVSTESRLAGDTDLALNLLLGAALRCWWADTGPDARQRVVTALRELTVTPADARYVAALAVAEPVVECAAVDDILDRVVLESVTDANDLRLYGMAAHAIGDPVRAVAFLDRAAARFREQGRLGLLSHVLTMSASGRLQLGDWKSARLALAESQQIARLTGQPIWDTGTLSLTAMESALRGDPSAHDTATEAEQLASGRRLTNLLSCVQLAHGFAYASERHYAEAYSALRRVFDPADPVRHERESFSGIMIFAEAGAHTGRHADARAIVDDLDLLAKTCPSPLLHNQLLYARAVLAEDEDAEDLFRLALSSDLVRWPWTKARLQLAYGSWLRRQRRPAESRAPLRDAGATFEGIGATSWARQAQNELRAAGERPAQTGLEPAEELLSPQELQIALMVADGLTNRQIGERLYLSPRTVGSHLYRIFPKLGISLRGQLAARIRPS